MRIHIRPSPEQPWTVLLNRMPRKSIEGTENGSNFSFPCAVSLEATSNALQGVPRVCRVQCKDKERLVVCNSRLSLNHFDGAADTDVCNFSEGADVWKRPASSGRRHPMRSEHVIDMFHRKKACFLSTGRDFVATPSTSFPSSFEHQHKPPF